MLVPLGAALLVMLGLAVKYRYVAYFGCGLTLAYALVFFFSYGVLFLLPAIVLMVSVAFVRWSEGSRMGPKPAAAP